MCYGINEGLLPSDKIEGSLSKINSKLYEEIKKNTIKLSPFDGASSNRTWIENEDLFYRIYRYGHGMDPARGELNFYKLRWGKPLIGVMDPRPANEWWFGTSPEGFGTVAMLVNVVVSIIVSRATPAPPEKVQEIVESIRIPSGAGEATSH